jgi:hypothetical protein
MNFFDKKTVSILISLVLVAGVATYFVQQSYDVQEQASKNALYDIQKTLDSEISALPAAEKEKGSKIDIDQKLSKSVAALKEMINSKNQAKQVLFQVSMVLANLYLDHPAEGSNEKGMAALKKASEFAKSDFQKVSALYLLSGVQEQMNQLKDAEETLKAALAEGYAGMNSELMLSLVRVSMKVQNTTQAKSFSEKLNKEAPGSRAAQEAQKLVTKS